MCYQACCTARLIAHAMSGRVLNASQLKQPTIIPRPISTILKCCKILCLFCFGGLLWDILGLCRKRFLEWRESWVGDWAQTSSRLLQCTPSGSPRLSLPEATTLQGPTSLVRWLSLLDCFDELVVEWAMSSDEWVVDVYTWVSQDSMVALLGSPLVAP